HLDAHVAVGAALHLVGHELDLRRDLVVLAAHEALDRIHGVARVGHGLTARDLTHETLTALREGDHGRSGPEAFRVGDDLGLTAFDDGDARVRGAQIDADDLSHEGFLSSNVRCADAPAPGTPVGRAA